MKKWFIILLPFLLIPIAGCEQWLKMEQNMLDAKVGFFTPEKEVKKPPLRAMQTQVEPTRTAGPLPGPATQEMVNEDPEVTRAKYCDWARTQFGLPVLLNKELKNAANEKLGQADSAKLFWPLAKSNNSFRCICGTPAEKKLAKC